ncbi:MAG: hypothetical protein AAGH19_04980 [Pseudomonadota bacterium]
MSTIIASPPGLFVLGMHRSGTSCLAGMLSCAGFSAGAVDEFNPHNAQGNREHLAVTPLNESILRANGGAWNNPPDRVTVSQARRERIEEILRELEAEAQPWMLKDPRFLLLSDAWLTQREDARRIGIFRHPLAVARSLEQRDGLRSEDGVRLWCRYNERLLALLEDRSDPLVLFSPDQEHLVRSVSAALAEQFESDIAAGVIRHERVADFFSEELVHHSPDLVREIEDSLQQSGVPDNQAAAAGQLWRRLLDRQRPGPLRPQDQTSNTTGNHPRYKGSLPGGSLPGGSRPGGSLKEDSLKSSLFKKGSPSGVGASPGELTAHTSHAGQFDLDDADALDAAIEASRDPTPLFRARYEHLSRRGEQERLDRWIGGWLTRRPQDPFLLWAMAVLDWQAGRREAAVANARSAARLAPGWADPLELLARWAVELGDWRLAVPSAQEHWSEDRELITQLFFDHGEGFTEHNSLSQPVAAEDGQMCITFDCTDIAPGVQRLRLDPVDRMAVVSGLALEAADVHGQPLDLRILDSNALIVDQERYHFETGDPQLMLAVDPMPAPALGSISVRFVLEQTGAGARKTLGELVSRVAQALGPAPNDATVNAGPSLDALRDQRDALTQTLTLVRGSLSGRLGLGITRLLMAPGALSGGSTSLDELERRWQELDAAINALEHRQN